MGNFQKDLQTGEVGEQIVLDFLKSKENVQNVLDVRKVKLFQDIDVDFLVCTTSYIVVPVEVKSDTLAHITGNIAYEVTSNKHYNTKGCFEKTLAKYIYYYLTATKEIYQIDVLKLREYVKHYCNRLIPMGDYAEGYLIKINKLVEHKIMKKVN